MSDTKYLLADKEELKLAIDQNIHNPTKEQLEYLHSLLNLQTSIFKKEKLNEQLNGNQLFFYVTRYNLYEGVLRRLKQINEIDPHSISIQIALPEKNWLRVGLSLKMMASPLLEIEMYPKIIGIRDEEIQIDIFDSEGFTEKAEKKLKEEYISQGQTEEEIAFRLKENQKKRNFTKRIANEIMDYWSLSDFEKGVCYDDNVTGKMFSFTKVYKQSIDD